LIKFLFVSFQPGNRRIAAHECESYARRSGGLLPPSPPTEKATTCDYSSHYGQWPSLLLSCSGIARREGKMTDWVPVLIVALIVVCATAYLLLDPNFRQPKR
jgi:hypothetical protein